MSTRHFALPALLAAKADPALVADDERHLDLVATTLARLQDDLTTRAEALRRAAGGHGQQALERDLETHRIAARLRALRRYGVDLCLGRMVPADGGPPVYVGRLGLGDGEGARLLVDWRSPAAEPFFAATHAHPHGLASRRRYRWARGRVTDYWDEVFVGDSAGHAALDDQSAFVASLGASRSPRMRDVLGTIQADQDAIIRAGSRGALVVDGGPGTGKTVVALHRTAYLLYADPRLGHQRGGVLLVGPHRPYLSYVSDVLPALGEEGVRTATLRDLVVEGAAAVAETDSDVVRLKSDARMVAAVEPAVALYEQPPTQGMDVETPWGEVWLSTHDWVEAFGTVVGVPHNEAREAIHEALLDILVDKVDVGGLEEDVTSEVVRRALERSRELRQALVDAWPVIEATDLVGDLWEVPAYLRRCAPWLSPEEVRLLQRSEARTWTDVDLPLLDAARLRLGDPEASRVRQAQESSVAEQREVMDQVVSQLAAADDSELGVMKSLRHGDLRDALDDADAAPALTSDPLAGPFAHVVVDEAQELSDAEWQMVLARCPSRSLTLVGDRAQARHGFADRWEARLARVGIPEVRVATLGVNYRTPAEVMAEAEPVIRAVLPDANVPTSIRESGAPVLRGVVVDLARVVEEWLAGHDEGTACVIAADGAVVEGLPDSARTRVLTPTLAKGLEFDLVVLLDPASFGHGVEGAVDRYVAMTRATQQLVVLEPEGA